MLPDLPPRRLHRRPAPLERLVFGGDDGADGWTMIEQADEPARRLELRTAQKLAV